MVLSGPWVSFGKRESEKFPVNGLWDRETRRKRNNVVFLMIYCGSLYKGKFYIRGCWLFFCLISKFFRFKMVNIVMFLLCDKRQVHRFHYSFKFLIMSFSIYLIELTLSKKKRTLPSSGKVWWWLQKIFNFLGTVLYPKKEEQG